MKKIMIILIIFTAEVHAADISFFFDLGYNFFRGFNQAGEILMQPVEKYGFPKIVENFPDFYSFKTGMLFNLKGINMNLGLAVTLNSTGGRANYQDYSGEYRYDIIGYNLQTGLVLEYETDTLAGFVFTVYAEPGVLSSTFEITEQATAGDIELLKDEWDIEGTEIYVEPGIKVSYPLNFFTIGIMATYNFNLNESYNIPFDDTWDAFRTYLTFRINFSRL